MTFYSPTKLPEALRPIDDDLIAAGRIVERLADERDAAVRADLTMELIRRTSLVEDTMERAVFGAVEQRAPEIAERARSEAARLRGSMVPIDGRTRHVSAIDVHTSDPEGFERELAALQLTLGEVRSWEATSLFPVIESLSTEERTELLAHVERARHHASEHPKAQGPIGRTLHKVGAKLDHFPDTAAK
jgi:hypothetical protein